MAGPRAQRLGVTLDSRLQPHGWGKKGYGSNQFGGTGVIGSIKIGSRCGRLTPVLLLGNWLGGHRRGGRVQSFFDSLLQKLENCPPIFEDCLHPR